MAPLPVMVEQGMAVEAVEAETHVKPVEQAPQATRSCPSVPTPSVAGVLAAVAVTKAPLAVRVEHGMAVPPLFATQQRPVEAAAQATRI
jgi:hypothetical protein